MRSVLALALTVACTPLTPAGLDDGRRSGDSRLDPTEGLILSEVMDHADSSNKYVEICNRSTFTIELDGVTLERFANGNTEPATLDLTGSLPPGASIVVTNNADAFSAAYGQDASAVSSIVSGNGDDVYRLSKADGVIDVFGEVGIDGSGKPWEYTDSVAHRHEDVARGAGIWDGVEWSISDQMGVATPFACGEPIPPTPPSPPPGPPPGDLLLTEVMDHPDRAQVKYVEVCNRDSAPRSLEGYHLQRYANGSTNGGSVGLDAVTLQPGQAWVIANSGGLGDFADLYGFSPDQASNITNGNGNDVYALVDPAGVVVDVFGEIGVDGAGTLWDYTDAVALRADNVYQPTGPWYEHQWTFGTGADATPGLCAPAGEPGGGGGDTGEPDPGEPVPPDDCVDLDGDGFDSCVDCDDGDATVYPGAPEACDGVDNDCDGVVADGEIDLDGDGLLDCEVCDEEGLWFDTQNLYGGALRNYIRSYSHASCSWNWSRRELLGRIDNDNGTVHCVYTDTTAPARFQSTTGNINVEHTWPQSLGASGGPAKCDLHHLFPTNMQANSARSSHPFGTPEPWTVTWQNGESRLGKINGQWVFEVPDDHKGNVARALFYMSVEYNLYLEPAYWNRMEAWHALDPVDGDEQARTQLIASRQGKVNPLVACPHLVDRL